MSITREMDDRYREALPIWQQYWSEADIDSRIAMGDQSAFNKWFPAGQLNRQQGQLYFNKILRVLNMVSGYQRKNRLTSIVSPIEDDDENVASDLSGVLQWVMQTGDMYNTISDSFESMLQCGLNFMSVWMDYSNDHTNGDIRLTRLGYNSFIMDPFWTKPDMSDCGWFWSRKWVTSEEAVALYPDLEGESLLRKSNRDGRFMYQPQSASNWVSNLVAYDEYWTSERRKVNKVLDQETGETALWPWSRDDFRWFKEHVNPMAKLLSIEIPTVRRHVVVNGECVYDRQRPWGLDRMPFIPVIGYMSPDLPNYTYRFQGIVRTLRDSQLELNKRRNKMLDVLDSQVNSGLVVKEDALVNPEDAFQTGQGRVYFLKKTANIQTDFMKIQPPTPPQGDFEMQSLLEKEIMENAGTTEELFGQSNAESGYQEMLRQGASLVGLQGLFDRLNLSQKLLGNMILDLIQTNFTADKVQRILNKQIDPERFFTTERERKYDCVVEQGILTATQRQMEFVQLLQLKQMGINIPDDLLLRKSTLQGKEDLVQAIQAQQQQASQMQQQQMEIEMAKLRAQIELLQGNTENAKAMARERETRAVSNIGLAQERIAQAEQDRSQASLDNAKALREIEDLDLNNIQKYADLLRNLQQKQEIEQSQQLQETEKEAGEVGQQAVKEPL